MANTTNANIDRSYLTKKNKFLAIIQKTLGLTYKMTNADTRMATIMVLMRTCNNELPLLYEEALRNHPADRVLWLQLIYCWFVRTVNFLNEYKRGDYEKMEHFIVQLFLEHTTKFNDYCLSVLNDESNMEYMNDEMITGFKEIINRRLARSTRNYVNYSGMDCPSNDIGDEDYIDN